MPHDRRIGERLDDAELGPVGAEGNFRHRLIVTWNRRLFASLGELLVGMVNATIHKQSNGRASRVCELGERGTTRAPSGPGSRNGDARRTARRPFDMCPDEEYPRQNRDFGCWIVSTPGRLNVAAPEITFRSLNTALPSMNCHDLNTGIVENDLRRDHATPWGASCMRLSVVIFLCRTRTHRFRREHCRP